MLSEALRAAVEAVRREMELARLRVLTRFEPPPRSTDFGALYNPAGYRANLESRTLELLWSGAPRYAGPLRVIGTWQPDDRSWLWPWHDPSLPPEARAETRRICESLPPLASILSERRFACEAREADLLARYVAHAAGWFGAYAAEHPGQPLAYLGVLSLEPAETATYCGLCFGNESDGPIVRAAPGVGLCARCAESSADVFAVPSDAGPSSPDPLGAICFLCGTASAKLLHGSHAAVCASCVAFARSALAGRERRG